jgi:prepilin-type N-terminal cleavage/methylation domain-containing protein
MTNVERVPTAGGRHSGFVIDSSFVIRLPHRSRAKVGHSSSSARSAFTLIELIVVVTVITILAGLVLSTAGYARKKGARARAETEIAAMSAACESYKADNGIYPQDPTANTATNRLNAKTDGNPMLNPAPPNPSGATYPLASLILYRALSGDRNLDRVVTDVDRNFKIDGTTLTPPLNQLPQSYFTFKPNMLSPVDQSQNVEYLRDPFGNSYGYSTIQAATGDSTKGYNPTFDLWSTAALTTNPGTPDTITPQWIKNW